MTEIPYCDETLALTAGCKKCELGCLNCWAVRTAKRLKGKGIRGYDKVVDKNGWTGHIELMPWNIDKPLHWKKDRRIFICSMSDLFHPKVTDKYIGDVFEVIRRNPRHTYLIFSKRVKRMVNIASQLIKAHGDKYFKHVQWILSLSTQAEADEKIPILLQIPAAVRLSIEPLLEPIDFSCDSIFKYDYSACEVEFNCPHRFCMLDCVIVGCESGPKRRPCEIEWVRSIVQQCKATSVPIYVKQLSINGKVSRNPLEWPEDLRIQQIRK